MSLTCLRISAIYTPGVACGIKSTLWPCTALKKLICSWVEAFNALVRLVSHVFWSPDPILIGKRSVWLVNSLILSSNPSLFSFFYLNSYSSDRICSRKRVISSSFFVAAAALYALTLSCSISFLSPYISLSLFESISVTSCSSLLLILISLSFLSIDCWSTDESECTCDCFSNWSFSMLFSRRMFSFLSRISFSDYSFNSFSCF
jgi:hypothetical protein